MVKGPGPNPIVVWCKACRRKLLVRSQDAGNRARCAGCGVELLIPLASESGPPPRPFGHLTASSPTGDETLMIERIGRRTGLIAGGVIVGLVLLAMVGVFGYMLVVGGPAAHSAEEELPPDEAAVVSPVPATPGPAARAPVAAPALVEPKRQLRPAVGITFANRGEGNLEMSLEPAGGGNGIQRVLKPGADLTLGLQPGTYKARFGVSLVASLAVTRPEIWVFTSQQGAAGRLQWQRKVK